MELDWDWQRPPVLGEWMFAYFVCHTVRVVSMGGRGEHLYTPPSLSKKTRHRQLAT